MRRSIVSLLLALSLLIASGEARANWQYSRWGMTPDQFAKQSAGSAFVVPPDQSRTRGGSPCLIDGNYLSGSTSFRLSGCFTQNALSLVVLTFPQKASRHDAGELISALTARYGTPTATRPNYMWTDLKGGNQIELYNVELTQLLEVLYFPLKVGGGL